MYDPLPFTGLVVVEITVAQLVSFGPYRRKVIVPVGLNPLASVAVSEIVPPTVTLAEATVEIVGLSLIVVSVSPASPHVPATPLFSSSPL